MLYGMCAVSIFFSFQMYKKKISKHKIFFFFAKNGGNSFFVP